MRLVSIGAAALALVMGGCESVDLTPASGRVLDAIAFSSGGENFEAGDKVRITARAGTFKPADTGHANELLAAPDAAGDGPTGILLGGLKSAPSLLNPDPDVKIAYVRWPAQSWFDTTIGEVVDADEFEATIHSDFLDVIG